MAGNHVIHVEVVNPSGEAVDAYSGNLIAPGGSGSKVIPLALNDATGRWEIRAHDVLTGQTKRMNFEVY